MSLDPARRAGLERSRATAIARDHFDVDLTTAEVSSAPFGVVVAVAERAVIVSSSPDLAVLGGVLVWSARNPRATLDLVVEHHGGVHARRAAVLAPEIKVHVLDGARLAPASAAPFEPPHATPGDVAPLVAMIERSGADVVVEDGIVRAEVAGLEVGRVVTGPSGSALEVGVGRFDREAGVLLHSGRPVESTLVDTIDKVHEHRRPGVPGHPINRIGRERWLRAIVLADPGRFEVASVQAVEPVPPRTSLLDTRPAALVGRCGHRSTLVVCTVGADLGLIPEVCDLVAVHQPEMVRILMPERDRLPYLEHLTERVAVATSIDVVVPPWSEA